MTDSTNLGEIVVTGQRRSTPWTSFPTRTAIGSGGGESIYDEMDNGQGAPPPQPDPCSDPVHRKIWNADARAVAGIADLGARAASLNDGSSLDNREFGANLFLNSVGAVDLSDVSVGPTPPPGTIPEVTIEPGGTTYLNWMGDIHNHPSGNPLPSQEERDRFNDRIDRIQALHPDRAEMPYVAMYIVVRDSQTGQLRVYAYRKGDITGSEVNPYAQPCPQ